MRNTPCLRSECLQAAEGDPYNEKGVIRTSTRALALLALLTIPALASAQVTAAAGYTPPDDTQSTKIGAVVFYDYTFTKSPKATDAAGNSISSSAFNVPRTYINITGNISHNVAFRITPDVSRESGTGSSLAGSYTFRMKYGYAQFNLDEGAARRWPRRPGRRAPPAAPDRP